MGQGAVLCSNCCTNQDTATESIIDVKQPRYDPLNSLSQKQSGTKEESTIYNNTDQNPDEILSVGNLTYPDGSTYEGRLLNNLVRHGKGVYKSAITGEVFDGFFK